MSSFLRAPPQIPGRLWIPLGRLVTNVIRPAALGRVRFVFQATDSRNETAID
jgi:hypothetical protein